MYTLQVTDEEIYQRLLNRMEQEQTTLDEVLRELLNQAQPETQAQKLVRLIDATELPFEHPFNARDAEDILLKS